jgi:hypothetical protein
MTQADSVHSTPSTNASAIRVWTAITSEGTRLKREELAAEISRISDEQLRANLRHTMSKLFMFLEDDLEGAVVTQSKPTFPEPASPDGAPGAVSACQAPVIPDSRPGASQALPNQIEPHVPNPTCSSGAGAPMTRRFVMNSIVALPLIASPISTPAMAGTSDRRALEAYASWLFMERRILCGELWPDMGARAERYDYYLNAGAGWHFRGDGDWRDLPQPSTRAAAVLDLVGVDWRQPKDDRGITHEDSGYRPELPPGWPAVHPDAQLLEMQEKIFGHKRALSATAPEIARLSHVWTGEDHRLHDEFEATRIAPTFEERKAIVEAMPEYNEYTRLLEMQECWHKSADEIVKQMWEIKAQTPEGRRAKVLVLLGYVMEDDKWRYTNAGVEPYDITRARDLLIEFVGGEASEQLRDQFAA